MNITTQHQRIIKSVLLAVVAAYLGYIILVATYGHSVDMDLDEQYLWMLNDSVAKEIDTLYSASWVEDEDVYNTYHYGDYTIIVWEFQSLKNMPLDRVKFNQGIDLYTEEARFKSGQTINKGSYLETTIRFLFGFKEAMEVNTDLYSDVSDTITGPNYKGIVGRINRFSLSNEHKEHQIVCDFTEGKQDITIVAIQNDQGFYLCLVYSKIKQKLTRDCIRLLNVSPTAYRDRNVAAPFIKE